MKDELRYYRFYHEGGKSEKMSSNGGAVVFLRKTRNGCRLGVSYCSMDDTWDSPEGINRAIGRSKSKDALFMKSNGNGLETKSGRGLKSIIYGRYKRIAKREGYWGEVKRRDLKLKLHKKYDIKNKTLKFPKKKSKEAVC